MSEGTPAAVQPLPTIPVELHDVDGKLVTTSELTSTTALPSWILHPNPQSYDRWQAEDPARVDPEYSGPAYEPLPRFWAVDRDARPVVYRMREAGDA